MVWSIFDHIYPSRRTIRKEMSPPPSQVVHAAHAKEAMEAAVVEVILELLGAIERSSIVARKIERLTPVAVAEVHGRLVPDRAATAGARHRIDRCLFGAIRTSCVSSARVGREPARR